MTSRPFKPFALASSSARWIAASTPPPPAIGEGFGTAMTMPFCRPRSNPAFRQKNNSKGKWRQELERKKTDAVPYLSTVHLYSLPRTKQSIAKYVQEPPSTPAEHAGGRRAREPSGVTSSRQALFTSQRYGRMTNRTATISKNTARVLYLRFRCEHAHAQLYEGRTRACAITHHVTRADTPSHAHLRGCCHFGRPVQPERGLHSARRAEKCREFVGTVRDYRHSVRLQDLPRRESYPVSERKIRKTRLCFFGEGRRWAKRSDPTATKYWIKKKAKVRASLRGCITSAPCTVEGSIRNVRDKTHHKRIANEPQNAKRNTTPQPRSDLQSLLDVENGLHTRANDDDWGLRQFREIGGHVESRFRAPVNASHTPRHENLHPCQGCQVRGRSYRCRPVNPLQNE